MTFTRSQSHLGFIVSFVNQIGLEQGKAKQIETRNVRVHSQHSTAV